jgi:hypothetical protein
MGVVKIITWGLKIVLCACFMYFYWTALTSEGNREMNAKLDALMCLAAMILLMVSDRKEQP